MMPPAAPETSPIPLTPLLIPVTAVDATFGSTIAVSGVTALKAGTGDDSADFNALSEDLTFTATGDGTDIAATTLTLQTTGIDAMLGSGGAETLTGVAGLDDELTGGAGQRHL